MLCFARAIGLRCGRAFEGQVILKFCSLWCSVYFTGGLGERKHVWNSPASGSRFYLTLGAACAEVEEEDVAVMSIPNQADLGGHSMKWTIT
ncbi:hypothetical protein M758_2G036600 [Ceratodon purpureus]|nr:hypothetical protein M758_2G036600 [Ceratodon purpureus]